MFSNPTDHEGNQRDRLLSRMAPEAMMDSVVPTDRGPGGTDEPDRSGSDRESLFTFVRHVNANYSNKPTSAQLDEAFGSINMRDGFLGTIADGGVNPWFLVGATDFHWWFIKGTKAV